MIEWVFKKKKKSHLFESKYLTFLKCEGQKLIEIDFYGGSREFTAA